MNIKFLQNGGTFVPPYAVYQPMVPPQLQNTQETSKSSSDKKNHEGDELLKSIYGSLKDLDGLPGDIDAAASTLASIIGNILLKVEAQKSIMGGYYVNTAELALDYLQAMRLIKNILFTKDLFDKARDTATANGGLHEVAINSDGKVIVVSEEGYEWKTPEEIKKDPESYRPLTNSELLQFRAEGRGGLAFNNTSLSTVANSMGMEGVTKIINDTISNLGSDSVSNDLYVRMQANQLLLGLNDYQKALKKSGNYDASAEDLYKVKMLDENLYEQAETALSYLFNALPTTAKSLLKMKTANGSNEDAYKLMQSLVFSKMKTKSEFDPTLVGGPSSKSSKTTGSDDLDADFVTNVLAGMGRAGIFNIDSGKTEMRVNGSIFEQMKTPDGKHIGDTSVDNALNASGLKSIIDGSIGVYFGLKKLNSRDLKKIVYEGDGVVRANLPIDNTGAPNFKLLDLYNKAVSEYRATAQFGNADMKIILNKDEYKELKELFNPDGSERKEKFGPFIAINGITTDGLVDVDSFESKNRYVVHKEYNDLDIATIKNGLATGTGKSIVYPDIDERGLIEMLTFGWNTNDEVYKGVVYIPITMNKNLAALGGNQKLSIDERNKYEGEYQRSQDPSILKQN